MMNMIKIIVTFVLGIILSAGVFSAPEQNSAKQALEQLRILQGNLSAKADKKNKPGLIEDNEKNNDTATENSKEPDLERRQRIASVSNQNNQNMEQGGDSLATSKDDDMIDDIAFHDVEKHLFPIAPEKIIKLRKTFNKTELAKTQSADAPPKPTASSQLVNLSPGSTPPVIRLSQGFVSSLVFLDSTGAPWPISAYDLGDPVSFNIQWDKVSNTMMIQSNSLYTYGNLAVRLQGLNTPVMLTLIPGQKAVDYRVDLRIQGYGPNAKNTPMEEGLPPSASDVLLHVLDGVPPPGSSRLVVSGGDARAWLLNSKMYVRTNLTILSPGWIGSMTSADGMHAYELQKAPVLLVAWHGKVMQLKVEGL